MERNGKAGLNSGDGVEKELLLSFFRAKADTSRGVKRCACIWCTPTNGICHAAARPFPVSIPTERLERIPGPLVAEMKSGMRRRFLVPSAFLIASVDPRSALFPSSDTSGRCLNALSTSFARFSWCDCSASMGWMPRYCLVSAVIFSRKCIVEAFDGRSCFSTIATEVSSLYVSTIASQLQSHRR